jgi:hypothetical protein
VLGECTARLLTLATPPRPQTCDAGPARTGL